MVLTVLARTLPFYSGETSGVTWSADGQRAYITHHTSSALSTGTAPSDWLIVLLPVIAALATWALVSLATSRNSRPALIAAWIIACAAGATTLLGMMTIGVALTPFAAALILSVIFAQQALDELRSPLAPAATA